MSKTVLPPLPEFYDDLEGTLEEAWLMLVRGAADRRAPFHTPVVASLGQDGLPQARTVVLRHADRLARALRFHTDIRSAKVKEFAANPHVQILAYDAHHKVQLRVSGKASVHQQDDYARSAWNGSQITSQLCYRQEIAPGQPASALPAALTAAAAHDGQQNFSAVEVKIDAMEWLYLEVRGHRRARFVWNEDKLSASWLAP